MHRQHTPAAHRAHQAKSNEASPQTSYARLVSRSATDIVCPRGHRCVKRETVSRSLSRSCSRSRSANCLASSRRSSSDCVLTAGPLRRRRLFGAEGGGATTARTSFVVPVGCSIIGSIWISRGVPVSFSSVWVLAETTVVCSISCCVAASNTEGPHTILSVCALVERTCMRSCAFLRAITSNVRFTTAGSELPWWCCSPTNAASKSTCNLA